MLVLVLEDDQAVNRLVRGGLGRADIGSISASSVAEAMEALEHNTFDVAILDLTLPDGSGLDVLARLRDIAPSVHVIVLSGSLSEHDRVNALELGADD
jgi:two-component system response regulator BasR